MFIFTIHRHYIWLFSALFIVVLFIAGCTVNLNKTELPKASLDKEQLEKLALLGRTSDEMLRLMKENNIIDAREKLLAMSEQTARIRFEGITTVDGIDALTGLLSESQKIFNSVRFSPTQGMEAAVKLRLAVDALTNPLQPMWQQYYKPMDHQLNELDQAVEQLKRENALEAFNGLQHHYTMIRPSLMISRKPHEVVKVDSLFTFLQVIISSGDMQEKSFRQGIGELRHTLYELFGRQNTETYMPFGQPKRPLMWSLSIGSAIMAALFYTAWRMFEGDRSPVTVHRRK